MHKPNQIGAHMLADIHRSETNLKSDSTAFGTTFETGVEEDIGVYLSGSTVRKEFNAENFITRGSAAPTKNLLASKKQIAPGIGLDGNTLGNNQFLFNITGSYSFMGEDAGTANTALPGLSPFFVFGKKGSSALIGGKNSLERWIVPPQNNRQEGIIYQGTIKVAVIIGTFSGSTILNDNDILFALCIRNNHSTTGFNIANLDLSLSMHKYQTDVEIYDAKGT